MTGTGSTSLTASLPACRGSWQDSEGCFALKIGLRGCGGVPQQPECPGVSASLKLIPAAASESERLSEQAEGSHCSESRRTGIDVLQSTDSSSAVHAHGSNYQARRRQLACVTGT